jgi:hypothetical protein
MASYTLEKSTSVTRIHGFPSEDPGLVLQFKFQTFTIGIYTYYWVRKDPSHSPEGNLCHVGGRG